MAVIDKALQGGAAAAKDKRSGQLNLFDDLVEEDSASAASLPDIAEFPDKERLAMEKEVLGYYLSSHPLAAHERLLKSFCTHNATTARTLGNRTEVWMGGVISSIKLAHTRNPKPGKPSKYANFDLEDLEGIVRSIAWPDTYEKFAPFIQPDTIALIRGRIDKRGEDEINLIVDDVVPIEEADQKFTSGIHILFDEQKHPQDLISDIEEILRGYPGDREVKIAVRLAEGPTVHIQVGKQRVSIESELRQRLDDLLGEPSHRLIFNKPKLGDNNGSQPYRRR
jgi:DNA polymerase-3 subunit alpha